MASLAISVSVSACPFWVEAFNSRWEFSALAPRFAAAAAAAAPPLDHLPAAFFQLSSQDARHPQHV